MTVPRRNPYLILGVDFATGKAEARRQFARQAKRRRKDPNPVYSVEDLTWALSQVEDGADNPEETVDIFRVPADPHVFRPSSPGLLNPPPVQLTRNTTARDPAAIDAAARRAAMVVLNAALVELSQAVSPPVAYEVDNTAEPITSRNEAP